MFVGVLHWHDEPTFAAASTCIVDGRSGRWEDFPGVALAPSFEVASADVRDRLGSDVRRVYKASPLSVEAQVWASLLRTLQEAGKELGARPGAPIAFHGKVAGGLLSILWRAKPAGMSLGFDQQRARHEVTLPCPLHAPWDEAQCARARPFSKLLLTSEACGSLHVATGRGEFVHMASLVLGVRDDSRQGALARYNPWLGFKRDAHRLGSGTALPSASLPNDANQIIERAVEVYGLRLPCDMVALHQLVDLLQQGGLFATIANFLLDQGIQIQRPTQTVRLTETGVVAEVCALGHDRGEVVSDERRGVPVCARGASLWHERERRFSAVRVEITRGRHLRRLRRWLGDLTSR